MSVGNPYSHKNNKFGSLKITKLPKNKMAQLTDSRQTSQVNPNSIVGQLDPSNEQIKRS